MITVSPASSPASLPTQLHPAIVRRRPRPLLLAPPRAYAVPPTVVPVSEPATWPSDLRFFVGCYVAGLVFFLIMLS